jgi:hypothetical protein
VIATDTPSPSNVQIIIQALTSLAWPVFALICITGFRKPLLGLLESLKKRLDSGASIKVLQVEVGAAPSNLPGASSADLITSDHMALIHSSWRYPKKDVEFGMPMWAFHVVIQAREEVLNRIESAKYILDPSYPNTVQIVTDRLSRFKLKELANGESTVVCEVKVKGQPDIIRLKRYINLTATGPRI